MPVKLSQFSSRNFDRGAPRFLEALWIVFGGPLLRASLPGSCWRRWLLLAFGSSVSRSTVWKPGVRVKFPWKLTVGDHCWIGEDAWFDNLAHVELANNVCVSQGAYLCTGNHDWSVESFDLMIGKISLEDGVWIGAKSVVLPGTIAREGAVLTAGSVGVGVLDGYTIYSGNPATLKKRRVLRG